MECYENGEWADPKLNPWVNNTDTTLHTHTVEYYINTSCVFCQKTIEFIPHLFFVCPISHTLWCKVLQVLKICKPSLCWRREVSWFCKKANLVNPCCVESRTSLSLLVLIIFGYIAINQAVFQH